ncbi:MAG: gas vesicle protein [Candidatus Sumerlaeota bacterium]|nr:gas vesicle protein [Candidatus Sumerlaeota bacterium]
MSQHSRDDENHITLCEVLDRVLNKGVVVHGDVTISVADIDLIYLGLRLLLTSIETAAASGALAENHRIPWSKNNGVS